MLKKENLEKELEEIQEQFRNVEEKVTNIEQVISDVTALKNINIGNEVWIPVHNGIFVKAKIEDTKNFMVNVGDNIIVLKNLEKTLDLLEKQRTELLNYREQIVGLFSNLINKLEAYNE